MIDIKFLRENPEAVKENIRKKFQDDKLPLVDEVIENDAIARKAQQEADEIRANKKKASKQIGALMAQGKKEEAMKLKEEIADVEVMIAQIKYLLDIKRDEIEQIKEDKVYRTADDIKKLEDKKKGLYGMYIDRSRV